MTKGFEREVQGPFLVIYVICGASTPLSNRTTRKYYLSVHEDFGDVETVVADVFDGADYVDVEKLGLNVGAAFEAFAGYLL